MMKNLEVARLLHHIADILEMQEVQYKPRAYHRAARSVEELDEDIEKIMERGELEEIPGVGRHIADKIREFLETGKLKYYENLKKKAPFDVDELTSVEGIGPKLAKKLYQKFKIKNLKELEEAALKHEIAKARGFGERSEKKLLEAARARKGEEKRMLISTAEKIAMDLVKGALEVDGVKKAVIVGSYRRRKPTIGDLDILVLSEKPSKATRWFTGFESVERIITKGKQRCAIELEGGIHVDLRVIPEESFGAALQYFTGSKEHNVKTRKIAKDRGMKLNEYGLFKGKKRIAGRTEEEVYGALGMSYIEPELREDRGEIEAALKGKLPGLLNLGDIRGDFHSHTEWSDGKAAIPEMAEAAAELGYEYLVVSDHGGNLPIAHTLDEKRLKKQIKEIDKANKRGEKEGWPRLLKGSEINIKNDSGVDVPDKLLKELDIVVAAIHTNFSDDRKKIMKRIFSAMENEHVDIIGHPTGRLLGKRKPYSVDLDGLIEKAKETGTALEINATPSRLDLDDLMVKKARGKAMITIGSDAHSTEQLKNMKYGVSIARRGWCGKKDILNTLSLKKMMKRFGK